MPTPPKPDPELLRACYLSGQISEAQWQDHLRDGDVDGPPAFEEGNPSISPLEAAMILGRDAMRERAVQFMASHVELPVADLMVEFAMAEAELLLAAPNRAA